MYIYTHKYTFVLLLNLTTLCRYVFLATGNENSPSSQERRAKQNVAMQVIFYFTVL